MNNLGIMHKDSFRKLLIEYGFDIFIGHYISNDDFVMDMNEFIENLGQDDDASYAFWPEQDGEVHSYSPFHRFSKNNISGVKRNSEESSFTYQTARALKERLNKNPEFSYPFIVIQICFEIFFNNIENDYEEKELEIPKPIERMAFNSRRAGFLSEVLPHYLLALDQFGNAPYSEDCYALGLENSFKRCAWSAIQQEKNIVTCPVASIIVDLWNSVYEKNLKGIYEPTEFTRNGAFPALIAKRVKESQSNGYKIIPYKLS